MNSEVRPEIQVVFDLLRADEWLTRCAIGAKPEAQEPAVRVILYEAAIAALERGDESDASLYAALATLLDDIEERGRGPVEAGIICALALARQRR